MKPNTHSIGLALLLSISATATAQTVRETFFSLDTAIRYGVGPEENEVSEAALTLSPSFEAELSPAAELRLSGRIRYDEADHLTPGEPDLDSYWKGSRPATSGTRWLAELRDAYVALDHPRTRLRLGKQQIVWGALDGIKVLDVMNPQSYREFILDDFGDSRIGLWSVYADVLAGPLRLEIALVPDTTTHHVPAPGAWFELTAPRFRFGAPRDAPALPTRTRSPGSVLEDGAAGVRLSYTLGRVDVKAVAATTLDFEPLGRIVRDAAGAPVLERFHERLDVLGLGLESAAGPFAFRMEAALVPNRQFNVRTAGNLEVGGVDHWRAALGVDIQAPLGLFVNVQYLHDRVTAAPDGLIRPRKDEIATLFVRRRFSYDRIESVLRLHERLGANDGMVRTEIAYGVSDATRLCIAGDWFYGESEGLFGQFQGKSRVTLAIEHRF